MPDESIARRRFASASPSRDRAPRYEVECRSRNDARCRFLSASPDTLYGQQMTQGTGYEQALGGR